MCGIAGVLYRDPARFVEESTVERMGQAIAHRGPDGAGTYREGPLGLVHRRLSIIDLEGGRQPMGNEEGRVQVVFNGEIYNHTELRGRLESKTHRFRTQSDTEVLVHLYEEHGPAMCEHLRGMYAFAIWDSREQQLFLARDRVGQKPLFIYQDDEKLVFGSELKAILAHEGIDRTLSASAIRDYLTFGIIPGDRCVFQRIQKLPAACWLQIDAADWQMSARRYWQLQFQEDQTVSLSDWKDRVDAKLTETIQAHRIADVPVGAFLSGGLDSSVIVSHLAKESSLQTFSIGFEEHAFNELPYAKQVAEQFGTWHTEQIVRAEAVAGLDRLIHHYDEPFADASAVPTMCVAEVAANAVKVVLSGDGGDEAFGGYSRYAHDLKEDRWRRRLPRWFRSQVLSRLASRWPQADWLPRPLRLRSALTNLSRSAADAYRNTLAIRDESWIDRLLNPEAFTDTEPRFDIAATYTDGNGDMLAGMLAVDTNVLLPDDFLTKVDRASMAFGLEVRPPLVDHELLELTATIPSRFKVRDGETKWLLKELYQDRLPPKLAHRRKQGFEIPIDAWLRGPLRDQCEAYVLADGCRLHEFVQADTVRRIERQHQSGIGRHGTMLWTLLVLGRWLETYAASPTPHVSAAKAVLA